MNGGVTTKYFKLERGARQGDPMSAYLFILALEILILIKNNENIQGICIFERTYLYSAYADDTTFFLKNIKSLKQLLRTVDYFSSFTGLKPNLSKCEIAGIGILKGVEVAVCGIKCVDLTNETIKILGIHYSYNKTLQCEHNFLRTIVNMENVLKLWRFRNLTLEGTITIFKTLVISKIVFLLHVMTISTEIINSIEKMQKEFLWNGKRPKIKHQNICSNYEMGGLKNADIKSKIKSLQCSWVKNYTMILNSFSSDHSPVFCSILSNIQSIKKGSGLWKFDNSLLQNGEYIAELKIFIQERLQYLNSSTDVCDQVKWEYLKCEIRAFTINFSKRLSKTKKVEQIKLEKEIKNIEQNLNSPEKIQQYDSCKARLEEIYENIAEGIKVRSRCQWYEDGEKSTKFFLNLEKSRAEKNNKKIRN